MTNQKHIQKVQRFKIFAVSIIFVLFYGAIIFRSYQLQILGNAKISNLTKSQYKTSLVQSPHRGTIYDRNGEILALDVLVASVGIHPHKVKKENLERTITVLNEHTKVSQNKLRQILTSDKKFSWVKRRMSLQNSQALEEAKLDGIQIVNEYRRFYPNKELAGQLLGAVGYDAKALGGLELTYDKYLRSAEIKKKVERDARGRLTTAQIDEEKTHNIYLTIDRNIQAFAEEALQQKAIEHKVNWGFAIVSDVTTGEILAMANYPEFNPNAYWKYKQFYWKNHAAIDVYEPGSTFKPFLMAAALEQNIVKPQDRFFCENGRYKIGPNFVNDHHPQGWLTASDIMKVSSNIGMTKISQKVGRKKFYNFIKDLGFGKKLDIGLGGMSSGIVRPYKQWRDIDLSNISFGQGLGVNGLQMMNAYTVIANNGQQLKPYLIKKIISNKGAIALENKPEKQASLLKEEKAKQLHAMLHQVTQAGGTAIQAHVPGYLAAGKTGTAQKFNEELKTYAEHQYLSSFIGFAPLKDPKLLIYVVYDSPSENGYYGGSVAGPVFKTIMGRSLAQLGYIPEQESNENVQVAKQTGEDSKYVPIKKITNNKEIPNLKGLSLRRVMDLTKDLDVQLSITGSGVVQEQWPQAGEELNKNKILKLKLKKHS
ncbi:MAG: penicillin-binding transpeptidase domain-containing protein [bacterium]|nr:PASTA domain-containing protein [bacterium]